MSIRAFAALFVAIFLTSALPNCEAQNPPSEPQPAQTGTPMQPQENQFYSSEFGQALTGLEQTAMSTVGDLSRMKIDKWKTDSSVKQQTQNNADSVQRNLSSALPALIQQVRATPANLTANFKLYRNMNALYDVLISVAESAGAFGSKDEYRALETDLGRIDNFRRVMGDRVETLSTFKDSQVTQLQNQVRSQAAAQANSLPQRVIVDDNDPPKKATRKKSSAKKSAAQPAQGQSAQTGPGQQPK